jgi:ABC-type phosphate transport system substrate-binding protein
MRALTRATVPIALVGLLLTAIALPSTAAEPGFQVIVHSSNPVTSLSREQVARLFLKKVTAWPSGAAVAAVDLARDEPARATFSQDVLRKSVAEVAAYWQQQIYSGRGVPPPEKRSNADVVAFVEGNEGAIGYVSAAAAVGDARVVRIVE